MYIWIYNWIQQLQQYDCITGVLIDVTVMIPAYQVTFSYVHNSQIKKAEEWMIPVIKIYM